MPDGATELLDPPATDLPDLPASEGSDFAPDEIIAADLLVEEISIDGMCGVY